MSYNKTVWHTGDIVHADKLNNIEDGIKKVDQKLEGIEEGAQVNKIEGIQFNGSDLNPDLETKKVNIQAAPYNQAMPLPQQNDKGKILGYESPTEGANPIVGWVEKPSDGITPHIDQTTKHWMIGEEDTEVDAEGKSAYQVYVESVPSGTTPMTEAQWLASLKGEKGDNAVNPFKGIYGSDNKPTGTFASGDYIYAPTSASGQTGNTIWKWDGTTWQDSGETPDLANGETFASSETLQEVAIDDSNLINPVNTADATQPVLARAEDVMQLKAKMEGISMAETKLTAQNVVSGKYIAATGSDGISELVSYASFNVQGGKRIRFIGQLVKNEYSLLLGYCFFDSGGNFLCGWPYKNDNSIDQNKAVQYLVDIPEGAVTFKTNIITPQFTSSEFYCYLQSGESTGDYVGQLEALDIEINGGTITKSEVHNYSEYSYQYVYQRSNNSRVALPSDTMAVRLAIPEGTQSIECIGVLASENYYGLAWLDVDGNCIGGLAKLTGNRNLYSGIISSIPANAKYVSAYIDSSTYSTIRDYSCYIKFNINRQVVGIIDGLDDSLNEIRNEIDDAGLVDKTITEETTIGSNAFSNLNKAFVTATDVYSIISDFDSTGAIKIPDDLKTLEVVCARSGYYNGITYLSTTNQNDVVGHYAASGSDNAKVTVNAASIPSGAKYVVVTGRHATISNCYVKFTTETIEKGLEGRVSDLEQSVGFPTRIDRIVESLAANKRSDIKEKVRPLKVFFIANSFAVQATELLPKLFEKFGYNVIIGVSYLGAATLQQYDGRKDTNNTNQYVKYDGNSWVYPASGATVSRTLLQMLGDENWDVVFFIQGSASAGLYSTYEPYYTDLLNWLPLHIQSLGYKVGWFMPWAWTDAKISTDGGNLDGGADNADMFANICSATEDNEDAHPSFFFCPCGTAVENQLNYYTQEQVWVDGQHTNMEGYYAATLVLFDKLGRHFIGKGISDVESSNPASELGVSASILANAKVSAANAITTPYEKTVID